MTYFTKAIAATAILGIGAGVATADVTFTEGHQGWGGPLFDFTQTQNVDGTDYFGWDPLEISVSLTGGMFSFDISMPRALTGGDNFDLVIDVNNNQMDDAGDFLVHYANNAPVDGWVDAWDAKVHDGSTWVHQDPLPAGVSATQIDGKNYNVSFDASIVGGGPFSYAWLSPLGDDGFPESWTGEAVVVSNWQPGDYVTVPGPASLAAFLGLGGLTASRRRRR